jgi:hypothetical protein
LREILHDFIDGGASIHAWDADHQSRILGKALTQAKLVNLDHVFLWPGESYAKQKQRREHCLATHYSDGGT